MNVNVNSALYECTVMHQRLSPKRHGFHYRVFYLWLDLDELPTWDRKLSLLSRNRWNLFSFYDEDHLGGKETDLKEGVLKRLADGGVDVSEVSSVRMLAFPRVLGYIFNPVTFYFAYTAEGDAVAALAQVTNTYHEQKLYVVKLPEGGNAFRLITPKHFYVSPFSSLELKFDFQLRVPDQALRIGVDDLDEAGEKVLVSLLTGKRKELSDGRLLACAVSYPLLTLRVIFLIHWHAFRLWLKKLPVHRKAADPDLQTDVLKPHASLQTPKP
jgi:DUF1365 family protein